MKKLMILSVLSVFALSLMAQSAFAIGDCAGKTKATTITDIADKDTDKS